MLIKPRTDWIQTYTGKPFWPLEPNLGEVDILDIAHSLSMQCRYAGHVKKFYSVAEHCVHISYAVSPENALWGLLHDATEAYMVDLPRPVKAFLPEYKKAEKYLEQIIMLHFGLPQHEPPEVKEMDTRILFNERAALLNTSVMDWTLTGDPIPDIDIEAWQPDMAEKMYLMRFGQLTGIWLHEEL
jgi:hypothetical protein